MRLVAAGDLHLGAGPDLGREPGERLREQADVLDRIVAIANELDAALLWLGDAWERRRPTPIELAAFQVPISKLERDLIVVPGNHDIEAAGRITGYDVALYDRMAAYCLIANEPTIRTVGDSKTGLVDVAILPWAPSSVYRAGEGGGDVDEINRQIAEKLIEVARGLYARCDRENRAAVILAAHWSVGGATTDAGMPADLFREPVLNIADLREIGFDAIALGHVHRPQMVNSTPRPVFYVGSPMPLNFGEATGEPRGVVLIDVDGQDRSKIYEGRAKVSVSRIPIESRPLVTLNYPDDHVASAIQGAIVKVKIGATEEQARRLDVPQIRRDLEAAGAHKVWAIQVDVWRAETARGPRMDETIDDQDALGLWLQAAGHVGQDGALGPMRRVVDTHAAYMEEATR